VSAERARCVPFVPHRKYLGYQKAANYGDDQGLTQFRTGTDAERDGQHAEQSGPERVMVELNINDGLPWSPIDLLDLHASLRRGDPIYDIAAFLCRSEREVRAKAIELGLMKAAGVSLERQLYLPKALETRRPRQERKAPQLIEIRLLRRRKGLSLAAS
jgi:hypothetical protein